MPLVLAEIDHNEMLVKDEDLRRQCREHLEAGRDLWQYIDGRSTLVYMEDDGGVVARSSSEVLHVRGRHSQGSFLEA
jgi:hypothetical protein